MAMVLVLFPAAEETPTLRPATLERLAELGVTSISLLRDGSTAGLVLEGWAFDTERGADAARAVTGSRDDVRILKPLMQIAVSSPREERKLAT